MAKILKLAALVGLGYAGYNALSPKDKTAATKALGFKSTPTDEESFIELIKQTIKGDRDLQRLLTGPTGAIGPTGATGATGAAANVADAVFTGSRMTLPNNGAVDLNGTSKRFRLWNDGANSLVLTSFESTGTIIADIMTVTSNGTISKIGGGSFAALSDERLKEKVEAFTSGLDKVLAIEAKTFNYKKVKGTQTEFYPDFLIQKKQYGVIAQQLQAVCPEMVTVSEDGYLTVDLSNLSLLLVNAVKELNAKDIAQQKVIDSQKTEITNLKKSLISVEERLTKLETPVA